MTAPKVAPRPAPSARRAAQEALGIDRLRPAQRAAVEALAQGRDTLLVMPTGAGKSAVYQIAGSMLPGPTVVVSPLIALQRDQMDSIAGSELDAAATLNSQLTDRQREDVLRRVRKGHLEYLLLAPEQLARPDTFRELQAAEPSLLVVDEAHCISEWGHDFRPDYLGLASAFESLGRAPVLAMTATASPVTRSEIIDRLRLDDPAVIVSGFDRPNLHFRVVPVADEGRKQAALTDLVDQLAPPGIVYVATRRDADDLAERLQAGGRTTASYHGGMAKGERDAQQERFMAGEADVMVATNAFGMGIDKPDVRFVIHHDVPESLDAYYQEAGRAGRDGEPATAVLLWRAEDLGRRKALNGTGSVDPTAVRDLARVLLDAGGPLPHDVLAAELDVGRASLARLLGRLEGIGAVTLDPACGTAAWAPDVPPATAAEVLAAADEQRAEVEESRLAMMRSYAEGRECRRRMILTYFGEEADRWCGRCDACDATTAPAHDDTGDGAVEGDPYPEQSRVVHDEFGPGLVVRRDGDRVVVLFDGAGYRTLSADLVADAGILRAER